MQPPQAGALCWPIRGSDITAIIGHLDWRKDGDSHVVLLSPIEYQLDCGRIVICERGFKYDGGSIPRPFHSLCCPFGTSADHAFCLHDRLYHGHRDLHESSFTRLQSDEAMLEVMLHCDTPEHVAYGAYTAVRAAGLAAWQTEEEREAWNTTDNHEFMDQ